VQDVLARLTLGKTLIYFKIHRVYKLLSLHVEFDLRLCVWVLLLGFGRTPSRRGTCGALASVATLLVHPLSIMATPIRDQNTFPAERAHFAAVLVDFSAIFNHSVSLCSNECVAGRTGNKPQFRHDYLK